jgi:hypothetical protein
MNRIDSARALLSSAESGLRDLGAEAAKSGNYDDVMIIAEVAKRLHELAIKLALANRQSSATTGQEFCLPSPNDGGRCIPATSSGARPPANGTANVSRRSGRAPRKNDYPRFVRRGDDLVKIGWSKGVAKEYQHKAPRDVVLAVAQSLRENAPNGEILSTEKFLPSEQKESGEEIPAYQAYVCLAWLRSIGLIDQNGRQGYSLSNAASLFQQIDDEWNRLPSK